ncbi:RNA recognition motif-containing protein [Babesia caballi]|uniref:RNA recognition motif-containing protein n=1 Tax=Babesia caballi TaxID=5871 RepID=A0AAV4LLG2_BABCB|nr:RNA recognition motif-containing protein [Babesia caballi]
MAHVAARLKKQKDDEVTKERERIETSRIYAEYVRTFDVSGAPAAPAPAPTLQFVRSGDSAARSSHETGQKQTVAGVFDLQGEDDADDSVDEHRAEYLKSVVPTAPTTSTRPASTGKTREIDAFIQELKEKQQRQEAEKALKRRLQCVSVTPSSQDGGRYGGAGDSSPRSSAACTLHVDNLSPEITQGDLDRYFGAYGRVDRIRTLRSNTPDRRAATFAFVTFSYASDAALAKEALHGADIMGYRCKIVWVQQHGDRSPPQAPSTGPLCGDVVDFFAPSAAPKLPRLPVDSRGITVEVPQSPVKRAVIDLTARYVAEGGSDLEAMIMANETPDGLLGFLFGPSSPEHVYYRWKVYSLLQGDVRDWRKEPFRVVEDGVLWHPPLDCGGSVADVSASAPGAPGGAVFETSISLSHSGHARLLDSDLARLQDLLRNSSTKRSSVAEAMLFIITHGECAFQVTDCLVKSIMEDTPTVDKKVGGVKLVLDGSPDQSPVYLK